MCYQRFFIMMTNQYFSTVDKDSCMSIFDRNHLSAEKNNRLIFPGENKKAKTEQQSILYIEILIWNSINK